MDEKKTIVETSIEALLEEIKRRLGAQVLSRFGAIPLGGNYLPDGYFLLELSKEERPLVVEVKGHVSNLYPLKKFLSFAKDFKGLCCLIAEAIDVKVKEQLRDRGVAYFEMNNELFFPVLYKKFESKTKGAAPLFSSSKGFQTESNLKLLFYFIVKTEALNFTQRQLSEALDIPLATVNGALKNLEKMGLLKTQGKRKRELCDFRKMTESWRASYANVEKNKLISGRFSPLNDDFFSDWKNVNLNKIHAFWGGEAGASLVTNYLRPGFFTIYTYENSLGEILKNLRLKKDPLGKIEIINAFWPQELNDKVKRIVPLFLIYCELINSGIDRNRETAELVKKIMMEN